MTQIPQLNITCGAVDCANGRHAFNDPNRTYTRRSAGRTHLDSGACKACGVAPVDWGRVQSRNLLDVRATFDALRQEQIRFHFWTTPFNDAAITYAREEGRRALFAAVRPTLERIVKPVGVRPWGFMQVPTSSDKLSSPLQYGQHAVAACCRDCVAKWHGVPNTNPLNAAELDYLESLMHRYLELRLPRDLNHDPMPTMETLR
jgi:hypothetical protein